MAEEHKTPVSVYVQVRNTGGEDIGDLIKIKPVPDDVIDFRKAVKAEKAPELDYLAADRLKVFPSGTTDFNGPPLGAAAGVPAGSPTLPVIVVAPAPEQNTGELEKLQAKVHLLEETQHKLEENLLKRTRSAEMTCQDESVVGKRLKARSTKFELPSACPSPCNILPQDLDPRSQNASSEDSSVNFPMTKIVSKMLGPELTALGTWSGTGSKLVDNIGSEHKPDTLLCVGGTHGSWPGVVTMFEGKVSSKFLKADGSLQNTVAGQAVKRARAILKAQHWREFVVVVLHCLDKIAFVYFHRDCKEFRISDILSCFQPDEGGKFKVSDGNVVLGEGMKHLAHFLANPALLGFSKCPLSIECPLVVSGQQQFSDALPICARSKSKAVFRMVGPDKDATAPVDWYVLKVLSEKSKAQEEFEIVRELYVQNVIGVLPMHHTLLEVPMQHNDTKEVWYGLLSKGYGQPISPSSVTQGMITKCAMILHSAARQNPPVYCNDVSPDNILLLSDRPVICDWGLASRGNDEFEGFCGKKLWAARATVVADEASTAWQGSLARDLESLYYVAYALATGEVPWRKPDLDMQVRSRDTGLGRKSKGGFYTGTFPLPWLAFFTKIRDELRKDDIDEKKLLTSFGILIDDDEEMHVAN